MPVGKKFTKHIKKVGRGYKAQAKPTFSAPAPKKKELPPGAIEDLPVIDQLFGLDALTRIDEIRLQFMTYVATSHQIAQFADIFIDEDPHHRGPITFLPEAPPANASKEDKQL